MRWYLPAQPGRRMGGVGLCWMIYEWVGACVGIIPAPLAFTSLSTGGATSLSLLALQAYHYYEYYIYE